LKGLRLTLKRFFFEAVTTSIPEQRKPMPPPLERHALL